MTATVTPMTGNELARYGQPAGESGLGTLSTPRGNLPVDVIDLHATVTGLMAGLELVQGFRNPLDEPLEATYVFPLPDRAAVTGMRMEADGRTIEAVLKERGQARADYDAAVAAGRRASIAEQERPDVFTMRVGNIMPGERVTVRLTLAGLLPFEDGAATFRMPLVVAPRYVPGLPLPGPQAGDGYALDTDAVPDASRITPPVLLPGFPNPVWLSAQVDIDPAGMPLPAVRASLRATVTEADDQPGGLRVRLEPDQRADRDFVLRLDFGTAAAVRTGLATCHDQGEVGTDGTFALTLVPPAASGPARPKDLVLILDRSGSMGGWKIVAARTAAARIVESLGTADRFAVLAFDHQVERPPELPAGLTEAADAHRFRAAGYLAAMTARGGTEMLAPLLEAARLLAAPGGDETEGRDKVLVLVTDGQVGNDDQILRELSPLLGGVRMHTIGVDTAVHESFLRSLAAVSGGRCELVESADLLDEAMRAIHQRIGTPVLTGLRVEPDGLPVDLDSLAPARLPDLYEGAPVVITGRTRGAPAGALVVSGTTLDGTTWREVVQASPTASPSLRAVWARMRIRDLEDGYACAPVTEAEALEKQIIATSLRFRVLSRFTALVAVDERVVNEGGTLHRVIQPVEIPHGWEMPGPIDAVPLPMAAPMAARATAAPRVAVPWVTDSSLGRTRSLGSADPRFASAPPPGAPTATAGPPAGTGTRPPLTHSPRAQVPGGPPGAGRAVPRSARDFAAEWQAYLRRLSASLLADKAAALARLATEIARHLDRLAADGLDQARVAQLRQLADDLRAVPAEPARLHQLWLRATDVLDALASDPVQEPARRTTAFWRRQP